MSIETMQVTQVTVWAHADCLIAGFLLGSIATLLLCWIVVFILTVFASDPKPQEPRRVKWKKRVKPGELPWEF
jgi:hypothetical protein